MNCKCGGETKQNQLVHNKTVHVLEFHRCDCGRQGNYVYYYNGEEHSKGEKAKRDFNTAKIGNLYR